jgi:hypothetical protein
LIQRPLLTLHKLPPLLLQLLPLPLRVFLPVLPLQQLLLPLVLFLPALQLQVLHHLLWL